ncbi:hypothetical protein AQPE_1671 [Aquipluma nitroreducens]|uniref:Uncharacterized protein n=1 Tax=Aquipluma nitroreducens TaxID=2010828 RepID=A0A5K7S7L9_9BACT|nr:hypothetical protein AQPE_1671 [Aquipluma nitroreducens]
MLKMLGKNKQSICYKSNVPKVLQNSFLNSEKPRASGF